MFMETPCSEIHLYIYYVAIATEILYCNMLDPPLSIHMEHVIHVYSLILFVILKLSTSSNYEPKFYINYTYMHKHASYQTV